MKISSYVELKREFEPLISGNVWKAYFRGTSNRVKREAGQDVQAYKKAGDLRFDLLNNPMERGVVTL